MFSRIFNEEYMFSYTWVFFGKILVFWYAALTFLKIVTGNTGICNVREQLGL